MKILHIYKSYYPFSIGGVEKTIQNLSQSLKDAHIATAILTTKPRRSVETTGLDQTNVHYFPASMEFASCPISFSMLKHFHGIAKDFDILHFHFPWPFADLVQLLIKTGKPSVVTYHSDIVKQKWLNVLYQPIMRLFLNKVDAIIASSDNYVHSSPVLKKYKQKVTVIPFGLDKKQYSMTTADEITEWQSRVGQDFFLFVGVLRYYKGLDYLLEAARHTSIPIVIAGTGPEEARLKQIKAEKKIDNVIFVGHISERDKAALHHLCHATIAPSHLRTEAFCMSLLESLIYGKPAISTELNTGTSFVNQHNVSGLVIQPANPAAIQAAMRLLLTDEALYQRLKQGCQTHYNEYFNNKIMCEKHIQLYKNVSRS